MFPAERADAAERADPGEQLVDVIDEHGEVVEVVTRARMRAEALPHRTVFIAVLDREDRVIVHQRADWKDVWPSRWDVCFGGVVDAGEAWRDAAIRELAEEAGVVVSSSDLRYLWHGWFHAAGPDGGPDGGPAGGSDRELHELGHVFLVRHDGPFTCPDGEVQTVDRVPLIDLGTWLDDHDVVDDSLALVIPSLIGTKS